MTQNKVQVEIKGPQRARFIEGRKCFGVGIWTVDRRTAASLMDRLFDNGVTVELYTGPKFPADEAEETPAAEAPVPTASTASASVASVPVATAPAPAKSPIMLAAESDIPAGFPERDLLISNGISKVAQLKADGIREEIDKISGIGPATMEKIGLAIADL